MDTDELISVMVIDVMNTVGKEPLPDIMAYITIRHEEDIAAFLNSTLPPDVVEEQISIYNDVYAGVESHCRRQCLKIIQGGKMI